MMEVDWFLNVSGSADVQLQEWSTRPTDRLDRIGMVARWQPVHRGHSPVLNALCDRASQALIGIGSSNRYDVRNPFTHEERADMIRLTLAGRGNYTLIPVPDLDNGPRWRALITDLFGPLDLFVTDNPYVSSLLAADYRVIKPVELVPEDEKVAVNGTMVRKEMACGDGWRELVPDEVADYIATRHLDGRFRREFGLQALAMDTIVRIRRSKDVLMG
jgi:nicotinamide-nucleotide adenylyltransferase